MFLEKYLVPDFYFHDIYEIDADFFKTNKIKGIVADIDNTLVTYDDPVPTESLLLWLNMLEKNGVKIAFVSNNNKKRVKIFNKSLRYFATGKSGKPFTHKLKAAMKSMGTDSSNTVMLGDQLLTDAMAGKLARMRTVVVFPIKDKTSPFFRFKRKLEVPYMRRYETLRAEGKRI
ncbi:MAG: YqeG family HAD IIIA-type phosphatase [Ruminococcaceae bacterium]|nr:YqeG family HAD IIIA-type phosphatase [Oscillospiraceae bacterium]